MYWLFALAMLAGVARADELDRVAHDEVAAASVGRYHAGVGSLRKDTTDGSARLVFAADPDDPLADAPFIDVAPFTIENGPPAKVLAHVDPAKLKATAARVERLGSTLALARGAEEGAALRRLEGALRDPGVLEQGRHLDGAVRSYGVTDSTVMIDVDPAAGTIVKIRR